MLVLDVGPSMHSVLPEIQKVCSMLIQKKVFSFNLAILRSSNVICTYTLWFLNFECLRCLMWMLKSTPLMNGPHKVGG